MGIVSGPVGGPIRRPVRRRATGRDRGGAPLALLVLWALCLLPPAPALADYSVEASSHNWLSTRDYSEYNLADNDPATAWAEGGKGAGEGEWVAFEFTSPMRLKRLMIRNGDQAENQWETCNRVHELALELSGGRRRVVELEDRPGVQYADMDGLPVSKLTLTIESVYPAGNFWNRSVTCLADVVFEAYAAGTGPDAVALREGDGAEAMPGADSGAAEGAGDTAPRADWKDVLPEQGDEGPVLPRVELPEPDAAEPDVSESVPAGAEDLAARAEEALALVRQYYLRLNTLDESFPELMAKRVYDQELFSFLYFQEVQKQLGTADQLRGAEVDLSGLAIEPRVMTGSAARISSTGSYSVTTRGQTLTVDEDARFSLVMEDGQWKILKKVDADR